MRVRRPLLAKRLSQLSAAGLVAPVMLAVVSVLWAMTGVHWKPRIADETWSLLTMLWTVGVPGLALLSMVVGSYAPARKGRLEVDESGFTMKRAGAELRFFASEVASGLVVPAGQRSALDLHLTDGRVLRAEMEEDEAEAVLDALGVGPERRRVAVTLGSETVPLLAGCGSFLLGIAAAAVAVCLTVLLLPKILIVPSVIFAVLLVGIAPLLARRFTAPAELVIGADGISLRRRGRTRVIPYAGLHRAVAHGGQLVLELSPKDPDAMVEIVRVEAHDRALVEGAVSRIRAMRNAGDASPARSTAALDPAGRSVQAWREALTRLRRSDGQYRSAPLGADDLLAVLEDGAAPAKLRIGAALALREGDGAEDGRARVRIAAEACADEELRAALEAAAEDEVAEAAIRRVVERKEG